MKVERHVEGLPLTVTAEVPDAWGELEASGFVLLVVGPEPAAGVLAPTVQVTLDSTDSPAAAWAALQQGVAGLPEVHPVLEVRRGASGGGEEQVVEAVHRGPGGGTQVTVYRLLVPRLGGTAVTVVGTCGGGAPGDVRDELRAVVASVAAAGLP